jgi:hypothetical protein
VPQPVTPGTQENKRRNEPVGYQLTQPDKPERNKTDKKNKTKPDKTRRNQKKGTRATKGVFFLGRKNHPVMIRTATFLEN